MKNFVLLPFSVILIVLRITFKIAFCSKLAYFSTTCMKVPSTTFGALLTVH